MLIPTALLVVPLTACSAGTSNFDAQTNEVYNVAEGVNDRAGAVDILNALVVSAEPGSGRLIVGLVNNNTNEDDELASVQGAGDYQDLTVDLADGDPTIKAGRLTQLADPGAAVVLITGEQVRPGAFIELTFSFRNAQPSTMQVPVVPQEDDFADVEVPSAGDTSAGDTSAGDSSSDSLVSPSDPPADEPASEEASDQPGG